MNKVSLEKLLKRRDQLDTRIKLTQARVQSQQRKDEVRKKILTGAYFLEKNASENKTDILIQELDNFLFRTGDRNLFGLPPRPENENVASESI